MNKWDISARISKGFRLPGEATDVAKAIVVLMNDSTVANIEDYCAAFRHAVSESGLDNILQNSIDYAHRLSCASGDLIFEDMLKLFSLRNDIECLMIIYDTDRDGIGIREVDRAFRRRIRSDRKTSSAAADVLRNPTNAGWWWYGKVPFNSG